MDWKASRMPQTVPRSPRNGAALMVVARMISRCSSSRKYLSSTAVMARDSVQNWCGRMRAGAPEAPASRPRKACSSSHERRLRPRLRAADLPVEPRDVPPVFPVEFEKAAGGAGVAVQQQGLADHDGPGDDREQQQQQIDRFGREAGGGKMA